MNSWSITDKGIVRRQNQDAFFAYCDEARRVSLLLVCDGMGGANCGNIASTLSSKTFSATVMSRLMDGKLTRETMTELIKNALIKANTAVFEKSLSRDEYSGMGTTFVAALITDSDAVVMNVGDSRAYHIFGSSIKQITRDHSVVEDMVARGDITRDESKTHPNRNLITRALGTSSFVSGDYFYPDIADGDFILLCSDGLTNLLTDEELLHEISTAENMESCCESLLRQGIARGAPDNITLVLFRK
jgi:serine/threonine protein phosphatase PrpC